MSNIPDDALVETWDSVYEISLKLAAMIESDARKSGQQFDAMIVIPRGSYYPANIISRELGFRPVDLLHACLHSYETGTTERQLDFKLGQMPTAEETRGKDLLIIEEICDTGHTLSFLVDYLKKAGAASVRSAVLHYKSSRNETGFVPDWHVVETDKWVVYPWESSEAHGNASQVRRKNSTAS